jgi:hypothetical protein
MFADMPRHQTHLQIVAAAGAEANERMDILTLVEIGDRLRLSRRGRHQRASCKRANRADRAQLRMDRSKLPHNTPLGRTIKDGKG